MMSIIDKQRIAAVATLEALGFAFTPAARRQAGGLHRRFRRCGRVLLIADTLERYEAKRWPDGK
jgi:hypothetical protein